MHYQNDEQPKSPAEAPSEDAEEEIVYQSVRPAQREGESFGMISVGLMGGASSKSGQTVTRSDMPNPKDDTP